MLDLTAPNIILNPLQPYLHIGPRKTPKKYTQLELDWYDSQDLSVKEIGKHAKIWNDVADGQGFINSNYGYLIYSNENFNQFEHAVEELRNHPHSRRALMIYTRPSMWEEYNKDGMSDFICTNNVQYVIRNNMLHSIVQMRSNDFIFGFFNDFFWQATVQQRLLERLQISYPDLQMGKMHWQAGSLHIYERHFDLLKGMVDWYTKP
jgi:thymidylate synthase